MTFYLTGGGGGRRWTYTVLRIYLKIVQFYNSKPPTNKIFDRMVLIIFLIDPKVCRGFNVNVCF